MNEQRVTKKQYEDYRRSQEISKVYIRKRLERIVNKASWKARIQTMLTK